MIKNLTWQQALVFVACLAAPVLAYKFLNSPEAAGVAGIVGMLLNFMMGRSGGDPPADPPSGSGPSAKVIGFTAGAATLAIALSACAGGLSALDDPELQDVAAKLAKCRAEARAAADAGASSDSAFGAYEACKKREGL